MSLVICLFFMGFNIMWDSFTDNELINLAVEYGLQDQLVVIGGRLFNREEVESCLTAFEHDMAFGV